MDTKYDFSSGQMVNRETGEAIPDDEPMFILRARDIHARQAIMAYRSECEDEPHREACLNVARAFATFAQDHPERMKEPGTRPEPEPETVE